MAAPRGSPAPHEIGSDSLTLMATWIQIEQELAQHSPALGTVCYVA